MTTSPSEVVHRYVAGRAEARPTWGERLGQLANAFAIDAVVIESLSPQRAGAECPLWAQASACAAHGTFELARMNSLTSFFSRACDARSIYIMCPASK